MQETEKVDFKFLPVSHKPFHFCYPSVSYGMISQLVLISSEDRDPAPSYQVMH